ncbi:unnamed protein product [Diamesa hyperborea]
MTNTHRFSSLLIILISGFKLGIAAPVEGTKECVLPLKPDWTFFSPLIFSLNGTLISTENRGDEVEDITLIEGDEVLLSCAPNYFRDIPSQKSIRAICREDKLLLVNGEEKDFVSELSCGARVIEEIITPVYGCKAKLRSVEYGYTNPIKKKSYVLGEACYSTKGGQTLFAHTKIRSPNNDVTELALKVRNVSYLHAEHPTNFYSIELMKALRYDDFSQHLTHTLGTKNIPQIGTKKFINQDLLTHKQYQPVLKLTWNYAIVNDVDELDNMDLLQEDISSLELNHVDLYTGTNGVLSLKNNDGEQTDVYLKETKFPVPKYIWYVVRSGNKATAFAIFNRAHMSEKDKNKDAFCITKCEEITWIKKLLENKQYKKIENGYVLCCEFNDFRRTVTEMPHLDNVTELLK